MAFNKPKKRFGQNFLADNGIADGILDIAKVCKTDNILEIGPGRGMLTERLLKKAGKVVAVEIDRDLADYLEERFADEEKFRIIKEDILKVDIGEAFPKEETFKVVANLPYYITTPILMKLFESNLPIELATVMVQKEVALRMCAKSGTSDYGALSLAVAFHAYPSIEINVPPTSFKPAPKVDSAVVLLKSKPPICGKKEKENLFKCVKAAFSQRRKTFVNAISAAGIAEKEVVRGVLSDMGLDDNIRGETLSLEDFLYISERLYS